MPTLTPPPSIDAAMGNLRAAYSYIRGHACTATVTYEGKTTTYLVGKPYDGDMSLRPVASRLPEVQPVLAEYRADLIALVKAEAHLGHFERLKGLRPASYVIEWGEYPVAVKDDGRNRGASFPRQDCFTTYDQFKSATTQPGLALEFRKAIDSTDYHPSFEAIISRKAVSDKGFVSTHRGCLYFYLPKGGSISFVVVVSELDLARSIDGGDRYKTRAVDMTVGRDSSGKISFKVKPPGREYREFSHYDGGRGRSWDGQPFIMKVGAKSAEPRPNSGPASASEELVAGILDGESMPAGAKFRTKRR